MLSLVDVYLSHVCRCWMGLAAPSSPSSTTCTRCPGKTARPCSPHGTHPWALHRMLCVSPSVARTCAHTRTAPTPHALACQALPTHQSPSPPPPSPRYPPPRTPVPPVRPHALFRCRYMEMASTFRSRMVEGIREGTLLSPGGGAGSGAGAGGGGSGSGGATAGAKDAMEEPGAEGEEGEEEATAVATVTAGGGGGWGGLRRCWVSLYGHVGGWGA